MAKPIICNEKATIYLPDTGEQCEYWLVPVHSVDDISNPDRNHAWILPNGDFWVYDGTSLVQINDFTIENTFTVFDIGNGVVQITVTS